MSSDASRPEHALDALPIQQVVAQLSLREFCKLCDLVDKTFGKTVTEVSNAETMKPKYATRQTIVKFDVVFIERLTNNLFVYVVTDQIGGQPAKIEVK